MFIYIIVAGLLGLVPGVAYFLIIIETWMIYRIAQGYHIDNVGELVFYCTVSAVISAVLKTAAHAIHLVPVIGQIANSVVAMLFVAALYTIADSHYEHLAQTGKHPDMIQQAPHSIGPLK